MKSFFYKISDKVFEKLNHDEVCLLNFEAEESDFIRFNHAKIRQATHVQQKYLSIRLIYEQKQLSQSVSLSGNIDEDLTVIFNTLASLRAKFIFIREDPFLNYSKNIHNTETEVTNQLPPVSDIINDITENSEDLDLVGILAYGGIFSGFSNSLGQKNWYSNYNFNFDFSIYQHNDKAVKTGYAGLKWYNKDFISILSKAKKDLQLLSLKPKTLKPGEYRTFLSPAALEEIASLLCWKGFGIQSHKNKSTALLKLLDGEHTLSPKFSCLENTQQGVTPPFTKDGFIKPDQISLIEQGKYCDSMISSRSALEYSETVNTNHESPSSLEIKPGNLKQEQVFSKLDTGIYANQLWYLNYSDVQNCRMTGMTRFATFWVEGGEIVAPLNVMRFDETIYNAFGKNLIDLTSEQTFIPNSSSYDKRSTSSMRLPGVLIDNFKLTL